MRPMRFGIAVMVALVAGGSSAQPDVPLEERRRWDDAGELLRQAHPAFQDAAARQAAEAVIEAPAVQEALRWSNAAGYLVEVRMQIAEGDTRAVPLGPPVLLGVGANPLEIVLAALHRQPLRVDPEAGMREAPEASFHVWVERYHWWMFERFRYGRTTPAESTQLVRRAEALTGADRLQRLAARRLKVVEGMRDSFAKSHNQGERTRVDQALNTYRTALQEHTTRRAYAPVVAERRDAAKGAAAVVGRYQKVLLLGALKTQAKAAVEPRLEQDIRKARNVGELLAVLTEDETDNATRANELEQELPALEARERSARGAMLDALLLSPADASTLLDRLGGL